MQRFADNISNQGPVGIFDSGVGGLSVLQHARHLLAYEDIIYVADSGYAPYGCQDEHFVEKRSRAITEYLLAQGVKAIVIACNTATASIIEKFRQQYGIPFIGVEPGIKPAIAMTKNARVGVLATSGTLSSKRYIELSKRYTHAIKLYNQACPGLADQVESGFLESLETRDLLKRYLQPLLEKQVDTIVLGCTHYSFLIPEIEKITSRSMILVDTSRAIAEQLERVIEQLKSGSAHNNSPLGATRYFSTGLIPKNQRVMSHLLGKEIVLKQLNLL